MSDLQAGQIVRVKPHHCLAYGRIAMVMTGSDPVLVRFADLPKLVAAEPSPDGFVQHFNPEDLEVIEGVPVAAFYLLVTVLTLAGTQEYTRYAIAHGDIGRLGDIAQKPKDVAETVAAKFFGSLGDWDREFYIREGSPYSSKLLSYEEITLADYVTLSRTTPDYDLGVSVNR